MPSLNELNIRFVSDDHGWSLPAIGKPVFLSKNGEELVNQEHHLTPNDPSFSIFDRLIVGKVPFNNPHGGSHYPEENEIWLQKMDFSAGILVHGDADLFDYPAG
jgi:hypothetical protein